MCDAAIGGVERSLRQIDLIEQRVEIRHARLKGVRQKEIGCVVERRIDLLSRRQMGLRGRDEVSGLLEREKIRSNTR